MADETGPEGSPKGLSPRDKRILGKEKESPKKTPKEERRLTLIHSQKTVEDNAEESDDRLQELIPNATVRKFYDWATEEQEREQEAGEDEVSEARRRKKEKAKKSEQVPFPIIPEARFTNSFMSADDYREGNQAMAEVIFRHKETPEDATFEDLIDILSGEERDVLSKKVELEKEGISPNQKELIRIELSRLNYMKRIADKMTKGETIKYEEVPGAEALADYVGDIFEYLEKVRDEGKFKDLESLNIAVGVFQVLFELTDNYPLDDSEKKNN